MSDQNTILLDILTDETKMFILSAELGNAASTLASISKEYFFMKIFCIYTKDTYAHTFNPLSTNPTNWSNTLKQFMGIMGIILWNWLLKCWNMVWQSLYKVSEYPLMKGVRWVWYIKSKLAYCHSFFDGNVLVKKNQLFCINSNI